MSKDTTKDITLVPACEIQLNNDFLVYRAIKGFKVGMSPSPNSISTMVLKHPQVSDKFIMKVFNVILLRKFSDQHGHTFA
jgi:hypothetical protein